MDLMKRYGRETRKRSTSTPLMILGIDLGTTNSLAALWRDGAAKLIPNAQGDSLTPSCVSIDDAGQVLVGRGARERLLTHPDRSAANFKRYMGSDRRLTLGSRSFRPEELSALVLRSLKADAETYLGQPIGEAIITVPAYFNDTQRRATRIAGELAGFKVERLLNEPTAAALAYGLHRAESESQFLVFDLGGGTFDVSILELFAGVMEVRASAGDNHLGGEDFVSALVDAFLAGPGAAAGVRADLLSLSETARLRTEAERIKCALSAENQAAFSFEWKGTSLEWMVDGEEFERLSAPLLERLRRPIERALRDSRLRAQDLHRIVLVGGATRMPVVHRLATRLFGRFPNRDIHPDEAIVLGAAVQAGLKARDAALEDVVMTDVCPYTLGIEIASEYAPGKHLQGVFEPILERNISIPASRAKVFHPIADYQRELVINVFQGESPEVDSNVKLGRIEMSLPRLPRSQHKGVEVRFTYDVNGLLEVEATELMSGVKNTLVLERTPGAMSRSDVAASLAALAHLKIHPRDQAPNRSLVERLSRLYEEYIGDRRDQVGAWLIAFKARLDQQDPREIEHERVRIESLLEHFERERGS
jgi:molecular chaperone HscC